MGIFEPFNLGKWPPGPEGKEYVIPADDLLRAISKVEQEVTLMDLGEMRVSGKLRMAELAFGLAAALRHAGAADATGEVVYDTYFKAGGRELARRAWAVLTALEVLMIPPEHLRSKTPAGKAQRGKRAASLKRSTSSSSDKAG